MKKNLSHRLGIGQRNFRVPALMVVLFLLGSCGENSEATAQKNLFCETLEETIWQLAIGDLSMDSWLDKHSTLNSLFLNYVEASDPQSSDEDFALWRRAYASYLNWPEMFPGPPNALGSALYTRVSDQVCGTTYDE